MGKDTTGDQLSQWLLRNGLQIKSCVLLTKYEGARSLTYKITVKATDYDKAINPDIWPAKVGVRRFKFFDGQNTKKGVARPNRELTRLSRDRNKDSVVSGKPVALNLNGRTHTSNMFQTCPGNVWHPDNSQSFRNYYMPGSFGEMSGAINNFENSINIPPNGRVNQGHHYRNEKQPIGNSDLHMPINQTVGGTSFGFSNN